MATIGVPKKTNDGYSVSKVVEVPMTVIELSFAEYVKLKKIVKKLDLVDKNTSVNLLFTETGLTEFTISKDKESKEKHEK